MLFLLSYCMLGIVFRQMWTNKQRKNAISFLGKQYWSKNLMEKAREAYLRHQNNTPNLKKLIYGQGKILVTM